MTCKLLHGDCLEMMRTIPDGSVDLVLTDPPYGTTSCSWDSVIDFTEMWKHLKRIRKRNTAIVLFGQEPFSSLLRASNIEEFKYDWYWRKSRPSGFVNAKLKPLKDIEVISVFSDGKTSNGNANNMMYYPQGLIPINKKWKRPRANEYLTDASSEMSMTRKNHVNERVIEFSNYPRQVLDYANPNKNLLHPTQKPVDLLEYLVQTYSKEEQTVLDFTMGSGSTGIACINTNRNFIGIEKSGKYFTVAQERIEEHVPHLQVPTHSPTLSANSGIEGFFQ